MHLTNYSVNKNNANYVKNKLGEDQQNSSKWTFDQLRKYYRENGIDDVIIFERIKEVLNKVIISAESSMLSAYNKVPDHRNNCYEIYGFDILLDQNLKVYLIECNVCPSLSTASKLDK